MGECEGSKVCFRRSSGRWKGGERVRVLRRGPPVLFRAPLATALPLRRLWARPLPPPPISPPAAVRKSLQTHPLTHPTTHPPYPRISSSRIRPQAILSSKQIFSRMADPGTDLSGPRAVFCLINLMARSDLSVICV